MNHFALFRILFACFLLYTAWPHIPGMETGIEKVFWGVWLTLFVFIVGGNGLTFLQMKTRTGLIEEEQEQVRARSR
ncbi:MAG TPA: hypothetical protein VK144_01535 [Bacillota bacterium]|nr:hypothetical protein [Bacillota bacterium]